MKYIKRVQNLPIHRMIDDFDEYLGLPDYDDWFQYVVNKIWIGLGEDALDDLQSFNTAMHEFYFYLGVVENDGPRLHDALGVYGWMKENIIPIAEKYGFDLEIGAAESYHGCTKEDEISKEDILNFLRDCMIVSAKHLEEPVDNCIIIDRELDVLFGSNKPYKTIQLE